MKIRYFGILIYLTALIFLSCDNGGNEDEKGYVFREEGKLTLYDTSVEFGVPNHVVFGEKIILDASHWISGEKEVEWEIYYAPNYEATKDEFKSSGLKWHDEFTVKGEHVFKPEGSGSYLIKAVPAGRNTVTADGILNVTKSPNDVGDPPDADLSFSLNPERVGNSLMLGASNSTDPDSTANNQVPLSYEWSIYKVSPRTFMYHRNVDHPSISYQVMNDNVGWTYEFTESGYYFFRLVVKDPIYDLARDNTSAIKYHKVYIAPQVGDINSSITPEKSLISRDDEGKVTVTIEDFLWYEVAENETDVTNIIVNYDLNYGNNVKKFYYFSTFADPSSVLTNIPADAVIKNLQRSDFRTILIDTMTEEEYNKIHSFSMIFYAYDSDGKRYTF